MRKSLIIFLTAILAGGVSLNVVNIKVQAQEASQSAEQTATAQLRQLKTRYRSEIESYRRLEQQQQIAQGQYFQLQTLASLEEVVRATQDAMIERAKVMWTYSQLLKVALTNQPGVDLEEKQRALKGIERLQGTITQHQEQLTPELSRTELQEVAENFTAIETEFRESSNHARALLAIGQLQTVYDKTATLARDMETEMGTTGGALKVAQRQRALAEVEQLLSEVNVLFDEVESEFTNNDNRSYDSILNDLDDPLADIYSSLSRVLSFLEEIFSS